MTANERQGLDALSEETKATVHAHLEAFLRGMVKIWPDYDFMKTDLARMLRERAEREAKP